MITRLATMEDKAEVLKLLDELGEEVNKKRGYSPHNTEAQKIGGPIFDEIITRKDTLIFVAEENKKLVGIISFYILPNIRHGWHRGHIEDFVISKTMRGQGIGTKLFSSLKEYCQKNNIQVIKVDSGIDLSGAHRFYEKNGGKFTEKMFRFDLN